MSVVLEGETIHLRGECRVEDAEPLLSLLQTGPGRAVDLTLAGQLHTALVQILVTARPRVIGPAGDRFTETWLVPLMNRA